MEYLVTGGAGFIGSHIVEELVKRGHRVKVVDDLSTGNIDNIRDLRQRVEFIKGSVCDSSMLKKAMKDVDIVLHQAAIPSVPRSIKDPILSNEANLSGTLSLLVASKDAGVKRFVYASSSSVYGDSPKLPKVETMEPKPMSPYGVSKLAGEHYCKVFSKIYGMDTVSLRYFNVFGPRQDPNSEYSAVIPKFIAAIMAGKRPTIYGDGTQSRDFTYVSNIVHANILASQAKGVGGEVFNVATGKSFTLLQIVDMINKILGKRIEPVLQEPRQGDIKHSLAGITKAKKMLGYTPQVLFEEGLKETIGWCKNG